MSESTEHDSPSHPAAPAQQRWERARSLFHACVALEPAAASALLAASCGSDVAMRDEVEALLRDARRAAAAGLLERPTAAVAPLSAGGSTRTLPPSDPEERAGSVIGAYRLMEVLGEGGFGIVYRAQQLEPVRRQVALKIIKLGMDTRQVIHRFEAERQTLALMDHPGIARVLDAGATTTGRPYFVMELVDGVPITEHCDREGLGIEERVRLLAQVCRAVQHAHQKGIIHRDIKPSNVLVTGTGAEARPMVIDFGIAKATSSELSERTVLTEFRQLVGTPEYMSPEQAGAPAIDIDTRSDIYALGVLLYELLVGVTPFDSQRLRSGGPAEMQRIIAEEEPPRPSARASQILRHVGDAGLAAQARCRGVSPSALVRRLHGDLDWIACKALEKDRARRYATALEMASDLERHLEQRPVDARPPSATYRVRKFVRRNRLAVASTAVIAALGTATAVAAANLVGQWERTRELEGRLQAEQSRTGEALDPIEDRMVLARLAGTRVDGRFVGGALERVLESIAKAAGVPLTVDWPALEECGVGRDAQVTLELDGLRADAALDAALGQVSSDPLRRPQRAVDNGVLVVSSVERLSRDTTLVVYDVRDFGGDNDTTTALRQLLTSLIDPQSWQDNGGDVGRINALGGSLVIMTTRENHRSIHALLDGLRRVATGRAAADVGGGAAPEPPPTSAVADAEAARKLREGRIAGPIEVRTLGQALDLVRQAAGIPVNVDWGSFAETGVGPSTAVAIHADRLSAADLLRLALSQVSQEGGAGEALREEVVDGALLVTSGRRLTGMQRLVAYDLAPLAGLLEPALAAEGQPEAKGLADAIAVAAAERWTPVLLTLQSTIEPDGWVDNGGDRGRMVLLGDRLVVQAAPGVQRQIRSLIEALAGAAPAGGVVGPHDQDASMAKALHARLATLAALEAVTVDVPRGTTLDAAMARISAAGAMPVHVDWAALEQAGASRAAPLESELRGISGRRALDAVLAAAIDGNASGVEVDVVEGAVVIGRIDPLTRPIAVFDVREILASIPPLDPAAAGDHRQSAADQLRSAIASTIAPDRWQDNGGDARVLILGDRLVVVAPTIMVRDVGRLLEGLRAVQGGR